MAGDWIKIEHATPDKPEVIGIADALGIDQDAAFGKLVRIWIWADQQTLNGNAQCNGARNAQCNALCNGVRVTRSFVDRCAHCPGFADAMLKAGWLEIGEDGSLSIPNFERHFTQTAKQRAVTNRRVAVHRKSSVTGTVTESVTESVTDSVTDSVTKSVTREEIELEKSKNTSASAEVTEHPSDGSPRTHLFFAMISGTWELPLRKLEEYKATYGDRLDVEAELRKARQWLLDNKARRPRANVASFLTRWLNRACDRVHEPASKPPIDWAKLRGEKP